MCRACWQVHPQLLEQHFSAPGSQSASVSQAVTHTAANPVACVSGGHRPGLMLLTRRRNWHVSRHWPAYLCNVTTSTTIDLLRNQYVDCRESKTA